MAVDLATDETRTLAVTGARRALTAPGLTAFLLDAVVVVGALLVAALIRGNGLFFTSDAWIAHLPVVITMISVGWLLLIALRGGYDTEVFGAGVDEYKRVAGASGLTAAMIGIGCYLAKYQLSRGFFVFAFLVGVPALLLARFALRKALQRARQQGHFRRRVVIVGISDSVDEIANVLRRESWLGYEVMGALTPTGRADAETPSGIPILGGIGDVERLPKLAGAHLVFFAGGGISSASQMRRIQWALEHDDIHVVVAPSMTDIASERVRIRPVGGLPLIHIGKPRSAAAASLAKRSFDMVGGSILLLLASPVLAVAALLVVTNDRGPALFRQTRIGRNGESFSCLKLRTMVTDAEDRLDDLHAEQGHTSGLFKMREDPRVTRPGRLLRRFSIDELPQLLNVVRGEMSLVGPRPPLPSEVEHYDMAASRRLQVRPGVTGLWQVSGRSNLSWEETVRLDIYYVDNWSMLQDLSILAKTVRAVLRPDGAY